MEWKENIRFSNEVAIVDTHRKSGILSKWKFHIRNTVFFICIHPNESYFFVKRQMCIALYRLTISICTAIK